MTIANLDQSRRQLGLASIRRRAAPEPPVGLAHLNPRLARVLAARGVSDPSQLDHELAAILPPTGMPDLERAAELVADAIEAGDEIVVIGDFDADGATATALCLRALRAMGATRVDFRIPDRQRHGYGLSPALVAELERVPGLVLTVDNGVSAHSGVAAAKALGCRVVVTDHHLPGDTLPDAEAIVNPNRTEATFGSRALAGVGVAFYLLAAVRAELDRRGQFADRGRPNLANWLDLVALGTVADVVELDDNNRRLVAQGLARIRAQQCAPGILALFAESGRDPREAQSRDLGFAIGPRLNAAGRLENMRLGVECLLADDPAEARRLAAELDRINRERRSVERDMLDTVAMDLERALGGQGDVPPEQAAEWVRYDPGFHPGVIGIVAGRLKTRWARPVFVFAPAEVGVDNGLLKGSGRSIPGIHLRDLLVEIDARHPGLIEGFGGHAMAAGLSLGTGRLEAFRHAFADAVARFDERLPEGREVLTDGPLATEDFHLDFVSLLDRHGPWGTGFPEPLFDNVFDVLEKTALKDGKHWRLVVRPVDAADRRSMDAIWFHAPDALPPGRRWQIAYRPVIDTFRGQRRLKLFVETALPVT
ncbi:single-stranded-DNA-specific exonuclease RecJ [Guyparkeria hydrothermalis]|uniref:single-stranded-DNA-specific exonuclease RecJ n=1 Tax=Guyparkeria hydrothermalis TaxID=923 RepID=UPI0020215E73|nr:single-stranded-DNA-specific exonuclease RecJ [Guyparkeria hydrothermalis]MCL7743669.1 single-stranded-DNA-specific exonuclease RecJ [Guyparkeria hydrothermalis]